MADTGKPKVTAANGAPVLSRKRKVDDLSGLCGDNKSADRPTHAVHPPLHLPAPVWGHILDFMPCAEVRSALRIGKLTAVQAANCVRTINIMRGCEMHIPSARRFVNVEEVNILCLLKGTGERDDQEEGTLRGSCYEKFTISQENASRIIHFLAAFKNLKRAFVGGVLTVLGPAGERNYYGTYHPNSCTGPKNSQEIFRSLVDSYFGAIKTGALPPHFPLKGVFDVASLCGTRICNIYKDPSGRCQRCENIISLGPFYHVADCLLVTSAQCNAVCLDNEKIYTLMQKRTDTEEGLKRESARCLCNFFSNWLSFGLFDEKSRKNAIKRVPQKWGLKDRISVQGNSQRTLITIWYLSKSKFDELDDLIELGLDPTLLTREYFWKRFGRKIGLHGAGPSFYLWTKSTVDGLAARGFPVDSESMPCIDESHFTWMHPPRS